MVSLRWRDEDDEDAIEAAWHERVGSLFGLEDDDTWFLLPSVQVGWRRPARITGGTVWCTPCLREQSVIGLEPVYRESIYASWHCADCGQRLDTREEALP